MQKIPTMFVRDEAKQALVTETPHPDCGWVFAGDGVATRKIDGANVKVEWGILYKRRKPPAGVAYDEAAYVPASRDDPADRWLFAAFDAFATPANGIYEAIGPKIQGNPEDCVVHELVAVDPFDPKLVLEGVPRDFDGLREYLTGRDIEGVVFHHEDGRKCKVKKRDFGFKR